MCYVVTDTPYLPDDLTAQLIDFIEQIHGADILENNLEFIASALGKN